MRITSICWFVLVRWWWWWCPPVAGQLLTCLAAPVTGAREMQHVNCCVESLMCPAQGNINIGTWNFYWVICLNIENQLSQLGRAEGGGRHGDGDTLLSYLKRTKLKHGAVCLTNFTKTYPPHFFPSGWSAATGRRSFQPTPDFKFLVGISEITFPECGWCGAAACIMAPATMVSASNN